MKALTLLILLIAFGTTGFSQTEITWDDLKFDSSSLVWSDKKEAIYLEPYFKNKIEILEDSTIEITGFVSSFDYNRKALILTSALNKSLSNCFSGNEQDEFVEIQLSSKNRTKINDKITVSGPLTLNKDDNSHLKYILEDAKIVVQEPIKITWEDLKLDSTSEVWSEEYQGVYIVPTFTKSAKKQEGKNVKITGFILLVGPEENYYELTKHKIEQLSACFPSPKPDQIIEVSFSSETTTNLKNKVTISGKLKLNREDLLKLNYILEDPKIVNN
ncbi:MAG: hypothetical protein ACI9N1_002332 [Flavobacteriales bacterium]|jgi:hypothetical protein